MRFTVAGATEVLSRTPVTLAAMLSDLSDEWLRAAEGPKTFSPFDVIGHMVDGERTDWMARARLIRSGAMNTPFEPYDRFGHWERNVGRDIGSLLVEFETLRAANLTELQGWSLTEQDLALTGTHPKLGKVTLAQLLAAWVVHDLGHIAQVARVMAKQYGQDIGPWREFLPVVTDRPVPVT